MVVCKGLKDVVRGFSFSLSNLKDENSFGKKTSSVDLSNCLFIFNMKRKCIVRNFVVIISVYFIIGNTATYSPELPSSIFVFAVYETNLFTLQWKVVSVLLAYRGIRREVITTHT